MIRTEAVKCKTCLNNTCYIKTVCRIFKEIVSWINWLRIGEVFCRKRTIDRLGAPELLINVFAFYINYCVRRRTPERMILSSYKMKYSTVKKKNSMVRNKLAN